jgi:hypothetical protein
VVHLPLFSPTLPHPQPYEMRLERRRLLPTATRVRVRTHKLFPTALRLVIAAAVVVLRTPVFGIVVAPAVIAAAVVAVAVAAVVASLLPPLAFGLCGEPLHLCFFVRQHLVGVLQLALELRR